MRPVPFRPTRPVVNKDFIQDFTRTLVEEIMHARRTSLEDNLADKDQELELDLKPLPDDFASVIGRLQRACAEFEFLIDLFLRRLTNLTWHHYSSVLGQNSIARKRKLAEELAKQRDDGAAKALEVASYKGLDQTIRARNVLSHGKYIGMHKDRACFYTFRPSKSDDHRYGNLGHLYDLPTLQLWADTLERNLGPIAETLSVDKDLQNLLGAMKAKPK